MRKTSYDGGDSTSITSGVENEIKKSAMKPKKSSLKRKTPNFSQESDDTVIEPLLQRDKELSEPQSAKYFGIGKTDSTQNKESDDKAKKTATTGFCGTTESLLSFKDSESNKATSSVVAPIHNYMNTNVFNKHDNIKAIVTTKSQTLVEIDSSKQSSYTPSPLIFTTAKIHTDAKTKQMEPVHMTSVPILSTTEVSISKGKSGTINEKKISNGASVINPVYSPMPLNKGKEEKETTTFSTVISPTINKDVFGKSKVTAPQSSSMKITLLSTTSNSLLFMKDNIKSEQGEIQDIKKTNHKEPQNIQAQSRAFNLDGSKSNVMVNTTSPSSEKVIDISTTSTKTSQGNNSQLDADDNWLVKETSYDSQQFTSNNKTPINFKLKFSIGIPNPAKNTSSSVGNKQLQRQKTTTEEPSNIQLKVKPNIEDSENLSAKMPSSSPPKIIDSISIKDSKILSISANNVQIINTKSPIDNTAKIISKTTPISTTTESTVSNVVLSNTVTTSTDVSSKQSTTNTISSAIKKVSPATTSSHALSNVNKISTVTSTTNAKSSPGGVIKTSSIPTPIATAKSPEATLKQIQPQSSISKKISEKKPLVHATTTKTTTPKSSSKNKAASVTTAKSSPSVTLTAATTSTQPQSNSSSKDIVSKAPAVTTSTKVTSASSITGISTKPSPSNSQVPNSKTLITQSTSAVVKAPACTSSIPITSPSTVTSMTALPQNISTTLGTARKLSMTTNGINTITETSSVLTSGKPSTVNSSASTFNAADVKSLNNNSSLTFGVPKPLTISIPKTESMTTLSKTSAGISSKNTSTASIIKSPPGTSATASTTKESAMSVKKPEATKTSVTVKSPHVSSDNKSIPTTKTFTEVSSVPTPAIKTPGAAVLTKTGSITTSTKTPSASTSTMAPDVTSLSSTTSSTAAINPAVTTAMKVSANKPKGIAGSSVPLSTPVPRPSELVKKSGSKSSENNKDSKVSKA